MYINRYNSKLTEKNLDCFTVAMFMFMFDLITFLLEGCVSDFRDYYFRPKLQTVSPNHQPQHLEPQHLELSLLAISEFHLFLQGLPNYLVVEPLSRGRFLDS